MGLELAEQFGWELPDVIFYPTGGGTGLIGMWKAFAELEAIGFIGSKRPRMVAVQAEGCAPMVRAWEKGEEHAPRFENAHTIASGIRVPQAVGDFLILRAVRECGGFAIAVSDEAIQDGVNEVAREEGFLMCPEGGATYAAYKAALADGRVTKTDRCVLFNCATGLKYPMPKVTATLDRNKPIDFAKLCDRWPSAKHRDRRVRAQEPDSGRLARRQHADDRHHHRHRSGDRQARRHAGSAVRQYLSSRALDHGGGGRLDRRHHQDECLDEGPLEPRRAQCRVGEDVSRSAFAARAAYLADGA